MSDNEMLEDIDESPPLTHTSQSFNIADVLSTSSGTSIAQDSMAESQYMNINQKSELSVDETTANQNLKKLYPFVDQSQTPLPRHWSPSDKFKSLILSSDCLRVHYNGKSDSQKEAASIRSNYPIPRNCAVYYFEILVVRKGDTGYLGIGLCEKDVNLNRLPGWDAVSYGYHGDDGCFFAASGKGRDYGPKFTTGDIVGCGINFVSRTIFFTKNGVNIGNAVSGISIEKPLYATIGMQAKDQIVDTNFGQSKFHYDIEAEIKVSKIEESELKTLNHIQTIRLPAEKTIWMTKLISDWLNNFGYSETLTLFNDAISIQSKESTKVLEERRKIMQLINSGRISEAIRQTNALAPQVLVDNKQLTLQLKIQEFIELFALMKSGDQEAYAESLEAYTSNEANALPEGISLPPTSDISASTSNHETPTQQTRNKRAAPDSNASMQREAKRRTSQAHQESRFATNPRRSTRNQANQQQPIIDESQNGHQFESTQQTNGHVEDRSTNGLATNGNSHVERPSVTNGATPPTSTNIIAEMDEDNYSYSSDFSSSEETDDWEMENVEVNKSKDDSSFPDNQFPVILSMGQKISAFALKVPDAPAELIKRMDDAFSTVCYDDLSNCPKSYLFSTSFRKHLANALNTAIVAVTNKELLISPEAFLCKAQSLRAQSLLVNTAGAVYADEQRVFEPVNNTFNQAPCGAQPASASRPSSSTGTQSTTQANL
ncbi:hypothetical protein M3Y97_00382200 [Aphelenchoides bicaudatus]|nr:hypothetical protein M3Y97_00382200 [Aphelenchoides bicaudatus]